MTPDQYRREGAEAMREAAAMHAECAPDRIPFRDHAGSFYWRDGLMDGARAAAKDIRAINVDEVLADTRPRCAECDCEDGNCTWIKASPAPDPVARLVEAAQFARNRLEVIASDAWNGDARDFKRSLTGVFAEFNEAIAAMETSHAS